MSVLSAVEIVGAVLVVAWIVAITIWIAFVEDKIEELLQNVAESQIKRNEAHIKAYERLTDPEAIIADMETSANIDEARRTNRLIAAREDVRTPAKVHRPKFLGASPTKWNPPRA